MRGFKNQKKEGCEKESNPKKLRSMARRFKQKNEEAKEENYHDGYDYE